MHEPTAQETTSWRIEELRRLEMCERALARAYRCHPRSGEIWDGELNRIAMHHLQHAAILRGRLAALGAEPGEGMDEEWVRGGSLREAERASLATYQDHLTDLDPGTAQAVREVVIPDHAMALACLDPDFAPDRDGAE
jgi:hypothetical protein